MNFAIANMGHSFKGSMAYYLHDKRQDKAAPHPTTAERVGWTETRNLAAASDPATATRIMIATAQSAEQLKAAAGVKATGRKATRGPVFAFAVSWRTDEAEGIDRAEMTRCADQALKILGLDHLQAVLIAHTDTKNPHVHVVVNRINPENGKATAINGMAVKRLDRWANDYEKERGVIYSPERAKKYEKIDKAREAHPDPAERKEYVAKKKAEAKQSATRATDIKSRTEEFRQRGDLLSRLSETTQAGQRQDWTDFAAEAKNTRRAIYDRAAADREAAAAAFREMTRGDWGRHFREERARERVFAEREKSIAGILMNAVEMAGYQYRQDGGAQQGRLSLVFTNIFDSEARRAVFAAAQNGEKQRFMGIMRERKSAALAYITDRRTRELIEHARATDAKKAAMVAQHKAATADIRGQWKSLSEARAAFYGSLPRRGRKPEHTRPQGPEPMKDQFSQTARPVEKAAAPAPVDARRVTTPAPEPRPFGIIDPPHSEVKPVPRDNPASRVPVEKQPSARRDWTQPEPATTAPAPAPKRSGAIDWAREYKLTDEQKKAAADRAQSQKQGGPKPKQ